MFQWQLNLDGLILDFFTQSVSRQSYKSEIELTQTEFKIIALFFKTPEKTLKKEDIVREVWRKEALSPKAFDFHLSKLREKLKPLEVQIHYQLNEGYRLQL